MSPKNDQNEELPEATLQKIQGAYRRLESFQLSPKHQEAKAKFLEVLLGKPEKPE